MDFKFLEGEKKISKETNYKTGLVLATITGGTAVLSSIICLPFILPALRKVCLPFVPATTKQVENVFLALRGKTGSLIDIGSGDGRIVIEAAKHGFKSVGVELNPWLVFYSKINSIRLGFSKNANFYCQDLWKFQLQPYKNVVIFGVKEMMEELTEKFNNELKDSTVVACRFPLPSKKPIKIIGTGIDRVWVYHFNGE
ncbi:ATP synthase subunit C lysine N-methyltransferase [Halyomorpha halys]|uniref:ATP synthase subunit C lysine N-methyltransferase n=1 Tax=Halyomorpha halys TaxID=286706 RepID=UPI0006D5289F|nr:protein FAM173B [Halyomorpha halys]